MPRTLWLLSLSALAALPGHAGVTVDVHTAVVLGEQREVSARLFGFTAFEGFPTVVADADYRARLAVLRPGCIRLPASVANLTGDAGIWQPDAAERTFNRALLFGNKYAVGRFLPVCRALGAEPMASLGDVPKALAEPATGHPGDLARWAELCAKTIELWRRADPGLRLVQVWNEPNASFFRDPRAKERGDAQLAIDLALAVSRQLKAQFPDLLVGGPVLCWPPAWPPSQTGQPPWYTWAKWTVPWLAQTRGAVDFFDFHVYNVAPDDLAVQLEMVANQALLNGGRALPIWITESNYDVPVAELGDARALWLKRVLPYERLLLRGMLPQADKLAGNLYHDLHARHFSLLPRGADDPDPIYDLFWVLRDLRGQRVVADTDDASVVSYATTEDDRVTVVVFNDAPQAREIPLTVKLPGGWWTGPEVHACGPVDGQLQRLVLTPRVERNGGTAACTVALPGYGTAALSFRTTDFYRPTQVRQRREAFGDATLRPLTAAQPVRLTMGRPPGTPRWLRLGLLGITGDEALAASLNGQPVTLRATAWQEVALPAVALLDRNVLEVGLTSAGANPRLAVGFAALVGE